MFDNGVIVNNIHRIINQIYKLLPIREENGDWIKPLQTITVEILGLADIIEEQEIVLSLASKLTGLLHLEELQLSQAEEFQLYRRTIFECLNLMSQVNELCRQKH